MKLCKCVCVCFCVVFSGVILVIDWPLSPKLPISHNRIYCSSFQPFQRQFALIEKEMREKKRTSRELARLLKLNGRLNETCISFWLCLSSLLILVCFFCALLLFSCKFFWFLFRSFLCFEFFIHYVYVIAAAVAIAVVVAASEICACVLFPKNVSSILVIFDMFILRIY